MNESVGYKKYKRSLLSDVKSVLSSDYFPAFTAVVSVISYYLGADLINIYIFGAVLIAMILLLDDLTPLFTQFLFLAVICSKTNSPMYGGSTYYTTTSNFIQIACVIGLIAVAAIYRFIVQARAKKVRFNLVFISVIALSIAYILNGIFSEEHGSDDLLYGVILVASLLPLYALMSCTVTVNEKNIKKVCVGFFIFSIVLVFEIIVALLQADLTIDSISFENIRSVMQFGWGMWNNAGMLLVICIAPVMYLALKHRGGAFFVIWSAVVCVAVLLSTSRQSYFGALIAYAVSGIYMCVKSRGRNSNRIAFAVVVVIAAVVVGFAAYYFSDQLANIFKYGFFDAEGDYTASGRVNLIKCGWENFLKSPVFGVGFYAENMTQMYSTSMTWFPHFYHNTIAQLLGSCGIVGLLVYAFHRVVTVVAFFKTRSTGRFFLGISMLVYLLLGLFDNHMYYTLSGFIYPAFIVILTNPVQKQKQEPSGDDGEDKLHGYKAGEDDFLDGLTDEERSEFFSLFIVEGESKIARVQTYTPGGDNRRFFKDCFVYLGEICCVSSGLMNKIYIAAQKYS